MWAFIGARSGSKGIKDKNIKILGGHPLLAWSIKACLKSKKISRVIVSTDSKKYADISRRYGAEITHLRSKNISGDFSTDFQWITDLLNRMSKEQKIPKYIAHIRPTTPLRDYNLIDNSISLMLKHRNCSALRSVHEMSETSYKSYEIKKNKLAPLSGLKLSLDDLNQSRQVFPKTYIANGYVDILKYKTLTSLGSIHGNKIIPFITPITHEIDNIEDFNFIEYQLKSNSSLKNFLFK